MLAKSGKIRQRVFCFVKGMYIQRRFSVKPLFRQFRIIDRTSSSTKTINLTRFPIGASLVGNKAHLSLNIDVCALQNKI